MTILDWEWCFLQMNTSFFCELCNFFIYENASTFQDLMKKWQLYNYNVARDNMIKARSTTIEIAQYALKMSQVLR